MQESILKTIKIVVVDDEPLVLRSTKRMIEQIHSLFKVVGVAYDGEEALDVIEKTHPDIVFIDIQMPIMDGLALIDELQKREVHTIPVILSGYQDFDYAKKALKLGVMEYLLKPISPDNLKTILNELSNLVWKRKREDQIKFLREILHGYDNVLSQSNKLDTNNYFSEYNEFLCVLVCSGSYCTFPCNWITPSKDFWLQNNFEDIVRKYIDISDNFWIIDGEHANEKFVILGSQKEFRNQNDHIFKKIHAELTSLNFPITTVIGKLSEKLSDLAFEITLLQISLYKNIIFGSSKLVICNELPSVDIVYDSLIDPNTEKMLSIFIQNGQIKLLDEELKKLIKQYEINKILQIRLESFLKYLINLCSEQLTFIPQSRIVEVEMEINELISNSNTYQSICEGICIIIDDLFNLNKSSMKEKNSHRALVENVDEYIKLNYSKRISLQAIAEKFLITASYLSSIFKKYKGISPSEYIIQLRIEKAKELLLIQPSLAIKDIADAIGYDDSLYFSRVFKLITGNNPSEYKFQKNRDCTLTVKESNKY